jgi:GDP-L-fucose synthase
MAAGRVGGIYANSTYPVEFLLDNLKIECNVIESAAESGVDKFLFLGSSCIYPKFAPQPLREDYLLSGPLEKTNEAYALAKIVGIKLCGFYNHQYQKQFLSAMPCNLYGPNDNYHPTDSHVLPALIRRFHLAKEKADPQVVIWGSGTPQREFLYSIDCARACVFLMEKYGPSEVGELINIGSGHEWTIKEMVEIVKRVVGYEGGVVYDTSKPDGTPRKIMDGSRIRSLGWSPVVPFEEGLKIAYADFLKTERT